MPSPAVQLPKLKPTTIPRVQPAATPTRKPLRPLDTKRSDSPATAPDTGVGQLPDDMEQELYARHVEVESLEALLGERAPARHADPGALLHVFYKYIQNPSHGLHRDV
jgi:hypothetical protein